MSQGESVLAAVFRPGAHEAVIERLTLGDLRPDEVLVRLVATGVCHTDLNVRERLDRPMVLGHEGAGIVERIGSAVTKVAAGDAVVLSFLYCGHCPSCAADHPAYCHVMADLNFTGRRADGTSALSDANGPVGGHFFGQSSFATHSVARDINVVKAPPGAPLELLGPLGCGVQTGAGAVMNVLRPRAGEALAVIGAGGVGMSALMAAVVEGCAPIIVVEPNAARRALALELGAQAAIDPLNEDVAARLREAAPGGLVHVVDTSGRAEVISAALSVLTFRGGLAMVTASPRDAVLELPILSAVGRGVHIHGVIEGDSIPDDFIARLATLVAEGRFPLEKLVRFYELSEINQAMADQETGAVIKPIIRMPRA